jgi:hypothetical protein
MTDSTATAPAAVLENALGRTRGKSKYFFGVALALFAFVAIGFGPTFFARPFFDVPSIPWYLFVHGFVLTSWFLLLIAQTWLVAARRTDLHRRLGVLGGFVAVALVGISLVAVRMFPGHVKADMLSAGVAFDATAVRAIVWTDLASLLIFSTFVGIALYWRRRSDVHKRLMLIASIAILGPAVARILTLVGPGYFATTIALFWVLPLSLVLHDILTTRRVQRTTVVGIIVSVVAIFGAAAIANSPAGVALVTALE